MHRRQYLAALGLSLAVPAAGCSAPDESPPAPDSQRVSVTFSNESGRTLVFTAAAVADPTREDSLLSVGAGSCGTAAEATVSVRVDAAGAVHQTTTCTDTEGGE